MNPTCKLEFVSATFPCRAARRAAFLSLPQARRLEASRAAESQRFAVAHAEVQAKLQASRTSLGLHAVSLTGPGAGFITWLLCERKYPSLSLCCSQAQEAEKLKHQQWREV